MQVVGAQKWRPITKQRYRLEAAEPSMVGCSARSSDKAAGFSGVSRLELVSSGNEAWIESAKLNVL